jgi:hypothetical protein
VTAGRGRGALCSGRRGVARVVAPYTEPSQLRCSAHPLRASRLISACTSRASPPAPIPHPSRRPS